MDWGMVIAIVASNIGVAGILVGVMLWAFSKLDSDVKSVGNRIDGVARKIDADMRSHMQRTDQLYQMFIDLLKSQKNRTDP